MTTPDDIENFEAIKRLEDTHLQIAYNLSPVEVVTVIHALRFMNEELGKGDAPFLVDLAQKMEMIARAYFSSAQGINTQGEGQDVI